MIDQLSRSGYRVTQPRRAVASALEQASDWLKPESVHRRAARLYPGLGLVTVYRTLALFSQLGLVRRIHLQDGCHGYARAALAHGHHVVCRDCQQVVEFAGADDLDHMTARVERATGFSIDDHMLELIGVCPDCQSEVAAG